jgi:protein-disulfide isomerase
MGGAVSKILAGAALLAMVAAGYAIHKQDARRGRAPVAVVAGQPIYEEELLERAGGELRDFARQQYEIKRRALDQMVAERLVEAEAKKKGVSLEKLIEQEADAKVPMPPEESIRALYEAQKAQIGRPLEQVRKQLANALRQQELRQARQDYLQRLYRENGVVILLDAPREKLTFDAARTRGNPRAPVLIVEFSDFQCPYCRRAQPVVRELLQKYEGKVRHAFRDFPLDEIHPQAQKAAEAARCAAEHGKFWEYHALLFENFGKLGRETLLEHARGLGLPEQPFAACLDSGKFHASVRQDLSDGLRAGVQGTPAFFINGIPLSGALPIEAFERVIESELASRNR